MNALKRVFRFIWAFYFLFLFCIVFLLLYPFFRILLSREPWYPLAHRLRAFWGILLMRLSGLRPRTIFHFRPDPTKTYVFVANHFSYLDILSMNVQVPVYFRFMAKEELAGIPLFSIFFRTIDIPVNRSSMTASVAAFAKAGNALKQGNSIGIFPEGGIGTELPNMRRFKSGAFRLAFEHKIPIVPLTIIDNWRRLPGGGLTDGGRPGWMRLVIHEPILTDSLGMDEIPRISEEVYSLIQNTFNQYNFAGTHEDHRKTN